MTDPRPLDPRTRRTWRIAGIGTAVLGTFLAVVAALSGAGGGAGLAFFLVGALVACACATLYAVGTGALDSFRGEPVGRSRVIAAVVLGLLSLLLPIMLVGLTGG